MSFQAAQAPGADRLHAVDDLEHGRHAQQRGRERDGLRVGGIVQVQIEADDRVRRHDQHEPREHHERDAQRDRDEPGVARGDRHARADPVADAHVGRLTDRERHHERDRGHVERDLVGGERRFAEQADHHAGARERASTRRRR